MLFAVKKAWSFVRRHAFIVVLALGAVVGAILFVVSGSRSSSLLKASFNAIARERALHNEEVSKIDEIHADEVAAREAAAKRAVDAVRQAEEQYRARNEKLDDVRRKEIQKAVAASKDDTSELAARLARQYGFTYIDTRSP